MESIEVLSPVGDEKTFFGAINSGCDAVYMGLPKFNARMRAENITLDNLPNLISFAHLKGVKVYITMNTLLNDNELIEAVKLAGVCLNGGVDAFIVQDIGLINVLKETYPSIVLHGSTQMGVHNVMGAMVAKSLGLSRVVLSRECTLRDIRAIHDAVDIELEVFVQGANCICFSGNCYLSSIKCGASGNRGECKQLCRLPYTLTDGNKNITGYTLSPRDNCMLERIEDLIAAGVKSIKIEGRLRQIGYIKVATASYREVVDRIISGKEIDYKPYIDRLSRVFSRGEYVSGYNLGNNIIDPINNNHLGIKIGTVQSVSKFKDLYKIAIKSNTPINSGDGLKFKCKNNDIVSIGVGNIEYNDKTLIVFAKNKVDVGSFVYLSKDTTLENSVPNLSKMRPLRIKAKFNAGEQVRVSFASGNVCVDYKGDMCACAINKPITEQNIVEQLSKVDKEIFDNPTFEIVTNNAFVPLSQLNEIRRELIVQLQEKLLEEYKVVTAKTCSTNKISKSTSNIAKSTNNIVNNTNNLVNDNIHKYLSSDNLYKDANINDAKYVYDDGQNKDGQNIDIDSNNQYSSNVDNDNQNNTNVDNNLSSYYDNDCRLAIVDENFNIAQFVNNYDGLILAPTVYRLDIIKSFMERYNKSFSSPLILNLPLIARIDDISIIDEIISATGDKVIFIANNIYGLHYAYKYNIWAGAGLNIVNMSNYKYMQSIGVRKIISSIEKWTNRLLGTIKQDNYPLMTITSCPTKLLYNCDCGSCKYSEYIKYTRNNYNLSVRRYKIANCYFELYDDNKISTNNCNIIDCRK